MCTSRPPGRHRLNRCRHKILSSWPPLAVIVAIGLLIQYSESTRLALLFLTGTALGVVLYQSRFVKPEWRISWRHVAASVLGGFLLGDGARLAYGCNIGAFFNGIASGSVHGWMWIVFALIGNWFALSLRPYFDLPVPNRQTRC